MSTHSGDLLRGLKVLDLSPDRVGAQVSQTLADFGAEVLWVEPPGGSRLRGQVSFPFVARGKHSIVEDLRSTHGVARVRSLAEAADVVIETFRPGVAERLGIGYRALADQNPALVYLSISGFGHRGPWAHLKGYEGIVGAISGLFSSFERIQEGDRPPFISTPWCSFAASQVGLHGVLAALLERYESGRGQWVATNMLQALTVHEGASSSWYTYLVNERWPDAFVVAPPIGQDRAPIHHNVFRLLVGQTSDGHWLQFAQNRPHLFEAFMQELGLGWMLTDPAWKGIPYLDTEEQGLELLQRMLLGIRERTLEQWEDVFAVNRDVFAEVYRVGPEVLDHPQLRFEDEVVEIHDAEFGAVRQPGRLVRLKGVTTDALAPAPTLGDAHGTAWTGRPDRTSPAPPEGRPVLEGVTVLELAVQYAAPYGTTLLADLGARVIKLEQLEGDSIRRQLPQFPEIGGAKVTQGKESVAVDIRTPEGRVILHQMAARADVVVNGFRAGAAERGGFDIETLLAVNPDILYVNACGYGEEGPCADRAAFATSFGAAGGIAAATLGRNIDTDPSISLEAVAATSNLLRAASAARYASADGTGALGVTTAALLGLVARRRGVPTHHLVTSMLLSTAHAMAGDVLDVRRRPTDPGPDRRGPNALYRIYDAADGWVFLAVVEDKEWHAFAHAVASYVDLGSDPRFATHDERQIHDAALTETLAGMFSRRGKDDWQQELTAADVACVSVTTGPPETLLASEEYGRASGYLVDVTHPVFDEHPRLAPVVRFSRSATQAKPGCLCGEATDRVLGELGYTDEDVARLRSKRIIG